MNTIILDIGTHKAEELRVLDGDQRFVLRMYFRWWFDWAKRQIKKVIRYRGLIKYGAGGYKISPITFGLSNHLLCLKQIVSPSGLLAKCIVLAIDPAAKITALALNRLSSPAKIHFLPIAVLPHDQTKSFEISQFFIEQNSLSSSLTKSRNDQNYILCPSVSFRFLLQELKRYNVLPQADRIVLRMNCEGSEYAIIQAMFDENLVPSIIMGSINDVRKKYGDAEADNMEHQLKSRGVNFEYFKGSDPGTWPTAFNFMRTLN